MKTRTSPCPRSSGTEHFCRSRVPSSLFLLALAMLGAWWTPTGSGEAHVWSTLQTSAEQAVEEAETGGDSLDAELDALLGLEDGPSVEDLQKESAGGQKFPLWLAQAVIPLSFVIMAFSLPGAGALRSLRRDLRSSRSRQGRRDH